MTESPQAASYRERCCNFGLRGFLIASAVLALAIVLGSALGGSGGSAPALALLIVGVLAGFYLFAVVLWLPYAIELREDWLEVGVRGVHPAGRVWRRQRLPLDAVRRWDVIAARELKTARGTYFPGGRLAGSTGNLVGPGGRYLLWIDADRYWTATGFPNRIWVGYLPADAAANGYHNSGRILIATRRPRGLTHALEQALPGRRLDRTKGIASREGSPPPRAAGRRAQPRGSTVSLPAEIAAELTAGRDLQLGDWSEAELLAGGITRFTGGAPDVPESGSSFSRLAEKDKDRLVADALEDLVSRGIVRVAAVGDGVGAPVPGTYLALVGAISGDCVFAGGWASGDSTSSSVGAGGVYGVRVGPDRPVAVLDERVDFATSRHEYTLRPTDSYVALITSDVLGDQAGPAGSDDGPPSDASLWTFFLIWARRSTTRKATLIAVRARVLPSVRLTTLRDYGRRRKSSGSLTEDEFRRVVDAVFAEACAGQRGSASA
ncbi:MAG TPA: hypothetical protein VIJ51_10000 [Solirubrobacteraceae bacterium]